MPLDPRKLDRRDFLKTTAAGLGATAVGASALQAAEPAAKVDESKLDVRMKAPTMEYKRLGRTNFLCSRIVQGFAGGPDLWRRLLSQGINYWDTGWGYGEGNHEKSLKDFIPEYRDKVWITSKATGIAGYNKVDEKVKALYLEAMKAYLPADKYAALGGGSDGDRVDLLRFHQAAVEKEKATGEKPDFRAVGKVIATLYVDKLNESLKRMGIDHVDCYFVHGVEIPWIWQCTELWEAYEKANKAGKVKHFGFSTHTHQKEVMAAAVEANEKGPWKIDLVMPGVNPLTFDDWHAELAALKKQDVGIIAMKTMGMQGKPIEGARMTKLKEKVGDVADFNEWEQKKVYMLHLTEGIIDACIAGLGDNRQMERGVALAKVKLSAEGRRELKSVVKASMAGACHLCGDCATHCPEHIALTDMIRYHSYLNQYNEKELARDLYRQAGYDPAKVCTHCGKCADACNSGVKITEILYQLSAQLA